MALNTLKCNHLMPLPFKGLNPSIHKILRTPLRGEDDWGRQYAKKEDGTSSLLPSVVDVDISLFCLW